MPSKKSSSKSKADDTPTQEAVAQADAPKADVRKSGGPVKAQSAPALALLIDNPAVETWPDGPTLDLTAIEMVGGRTRQIPRAEFASWDEAIAWAQEVGDTLTLQFNRHESGELWPDDIDGKLIIE